MVFETYAQSLCDVSFTFFLHSPIVVAHHLFSPTPQKDCGGSWRHPSALHVLGFLRNGGYELRRLQQAYAFVVGDGSCIGQYRIVFGFGLCSLQDFREIQSPIKIHLRHQGVTRSQCRVTTEVSVRRPQYFCAMENCTRCDPRVMHCSAFRTAGIQQREIFFEKP